MDQELFPGLPLLIVDDEQDFLKSLRFVLKTNGITNLECCQDSREVIPRLKKKKFSVILLDLLMPLHISGEELLPEIVEQYPEIPVIIITAHADIEKARDCMKKGAFDYLMKPFETKELLRKINDALYLKAFNIEIILLKKELFSGSFPKPTNFPDITSRSEKMQSIFQMIGLIAFTSKPILILGEAGVGKKFVARVIHKQSRRRGQFIEFNTSGVDDNSFEDILSGHKKGPLDKVVKDTKGLFEEARDGTLFFNEIANLPIQFQAKLFHLIKECEYLPHGSDKPVSTNVRIIAATNKNPSALIKANYFRQDLYSLLKANDINIPPLREHREDIPLLLNYFVKQAAEESGIKKPQVSEEIYILLEQYNFPGNIDELKNMVYEAISRHKSGNLTADVFEEKIKNRPLFLYTGIEIPADKKVIFEKNLPTFAEMEAIYMAEIMKRSGGDKSLAANMAGLIEVRFIQRLKKIKKNQKKEKGKRIRIK
jgi:DNA-binding NtrC family response regulator